MIYDGRNKMNKNVLEKAIAYLAGPMDVAVDGGKEWRKYIIEGLKKRNINMVVLDPTNKPKCLTPELDGEQQIHQKLKKNHKWKELSKHIKKIVREDCRMVDLSDLIIVKIDKNIYACGTYNEVSIASVQNKPTLAIIEGGKENAPSWLFGILDYKTMFDSEDECLDYLEKINDGKIKLNSKWVLIRKYL